MEERQPTRQLGSLGPQTPTLVLGERPLLQLDRARMLAAELRRLSEPVENLGALAESGSLFEQGAREPPVSSRKCLPTRQ